MKKNLQIETTFRRFQTFGRLAIALVIFLIGGTAHSQSFTVFDIDTSDFPIMRAKFWAIDSGGEQITNLSPSDFEVKENGEIRDVLNVSCPAPKPPDALSSVLVMDASGSMDGGNLNLAKEAAREWIEGLPLGKSECALTTFNNSNYMVQDITTDKTKLLNATNSLFASGGTDYDAAILNPLAGGLQVTKKGKHKRVIVFLTDGHPNHEPQVDKIILEANLQNVAIYSVTLGMSCPQSVQQISEQTEGQWFENVSTVEQVRKIYQQILQTAQGGDPCEIEWESGITCNSGMINLSILNTNMNLTSNTSYRPSKNAIASIKCNPSYVQFENPDIGQPNSQKISITALNSKFEITDITSSNPNFEISPTKFILKNGESIELTITYIPVDSGYTYSKFEFINNICEQYCYASGGWNGIKPKVSTLKITHPNGGEVFVVGCDTVITWEGISPAEEVQLDYSIDNGTSWNVLTKKAKGLKYIWKNVPKPESNTCLVRVTQVGMPDHYNPNDPTPQIIWQKTFGGSSNDGLRSIIECSDGTILVAGYSESSDGDINENKGFTDFFLAKLNPNNGSIIWQKTLGGRLPEQAYKIIESSDGNYVVAGNTYSSDGDVTENKGNSDCWVVKLNQNDGNIIWQKTYGGNSYDFASSIIESSDGSYIVNGYVNSYDGDVTENKGISDCWILKLDPYDGSIIWQKTFGGSRADWAGTIIESSDGNYVVAGNTYSLDGDVTENKGDSDCWVVKLNQNNGSIIWQKTFGGNEEDWASSIIENRNGNYVVAGYTYSSDGDVSENKGLPDCWIVKLNPINGNIIWERSFGGKALDIARYIIESSDRNIVVFGNTESTDGDVTENKGEIDYWILKINPQDGRIIWQKTLGGSKNDIAYSIIESSDYSYVLAGHTESSDGDITENKGDFDIWVVKLSESFIIQSDTSDAVFSIVEPEIKSRDIDMKQVLVNNTKDSVVVDFVQNFGSWKFRVDSIFFRGADADAFDLVSGFPVYSIEPNLSHFGEFRFIPQRIGMHNAEIVIITQADTLIQNIKGEGVEQRLEVVDNLIDFGEVNVGNYKDTLQTVTIKNISSVPIEIINTQHNYPNAIDFSTLAGGGNFNLQPDETKLMDLRFTPSDEGRTSGTLEFHYNGVSSPAVVQLFGEGVNRAPEITANFTGFDNLICDILSLNIVEVINKGAMPLEITEMNLTGSDPNDFTINETLPVTVQPDSIINLDLSFTPNSAGDKSAILNIISNAATEPEYQIDLFGRKDSVALIPERFVVDLGFLCPNEGKDTSITILNKGTIFSGGFVTGNSNLQIQNNEFQIDIDDQVFVDFAFNGQSNEGSFEEILIITDSICGYNREISIIGEVVLPIISADDISITTMNGNTKSALMTIANNSERDVNVTGINNISAPFEVVGNPFPFMIAADGTYDIEISYTPDDDIEDNVTVTFTGEPCNITTEAEITGMPVSSSASIQTPNLEAYPGDEIDVSIILNSSENIQVAEIESISADLIFNPTLLYPTGYDIERIDDKTAKIRVEDIPLNSQQGEVLKSIDFIVGLGNAEGCDLILSNPTVNGGEAEIDLISGRFDLLGICYEGGTRLISPSSESGITSISPNPTDGEIEIGLNLIEKGYTKLTIYNTMGEKMSSILSENIEITGEQTINLDISKYSSGLYFIVLQTPSHHFTEEVMILK